VKRERFFECVFASKQAEYHLHVRAWTPTDAELAFVQALRANGVKSNGDVRVLDAHSRVALRSKFRGTRHAAGSVPLSTV